MISVSIKTEAPRGNVYTLLDDLTSDGITVPAGFESDGASVPHFLWQPVFPPGDPKAIRAAFLHDYIYRTHPAGWPRAAADKAFRRNLIADGCKRWKADLAYIGVRIFGWRAWQGTALHPAAGRVGGDCTAQPTGEPQCEGGQNGGEK